MPAGTPTPWSYALIRLLFRFVLKIFYGTIVVENAELIAGTGTPCIVCANHSNSLTDALLLVVTIPSKIRNMLRLTAKSTQFGKPTFTSWLIESAGAVPIVRRKDVVDGAADNSEVMGKLMEAVEGGDAVCLFPEGMSRYHPTIAPLKTGVARLISDVLTRNRDNPDFEVALQTCSITYMHRQHFRSDVLVTFHAPVIYRVKDHPELLAPVDYKEIRAVTAHMHELISSGTTDSPTWELVRTGKLAARMYAPLGTRMSLGDHVRLGRTFSEAFKRPGSKTDDSGTEVVFEAHIDAPGRQNLQQGLKEYQDRLAYWGIKDDRIRRPLPRLVIVKRMIVRFTWFCCLLALSFPGLMLWLPVFGSTFYAVHNFKKTGPIFDTWDEIAQYKLIYGLFSGIGVWLLSTLATFPFAGVTFFLVPALMWMSLRWMEDAVSSFRSFTALYRLLRVGQSSLKDMHETRKDLHSQVMNLATELGLPADPESHFTMRGGREKGRVSGTWDSGARYFSLKRRRKRDWNETLRLYDKVDYPDEGL